MSALGIVGRGRAARSLVPLWRESGQRLAWWWSRSDEGALEDQAPVDIVVVAVNDAAIEEVASRLAQRSSAAEETWLHLSGSRPANILRVDPQRPGSVGCMHPMVALTGRDSAAHLAGATAGVDGEAAGRRAAERLAGQLGLSPRTLDSDHKTLYHAAAVSVAGHATALLQQAIEMLSACGFQPTEAREALIPLMSGAIDNLRTRDPRDAITGPIARGDASTVRAHLAELDRLSSHLAQTYRCLARTALDLSRDTLDAEARDALQNTIFAGHDPSG